MAPYLLHFHQLNKVFFLGFVFSHRAGGTCAYTAVPSGMRSSRQSSASKAAGSSFCSRLQWGCNHNPERWGEDGAGELVFMEAIQLGGDRDDHHKEGQVRDYICITPLIP